MLSLSELDITENHTLYDILDLVPLDVVQLNIWNKISDVNHCSFRLTCQHALRLADACITHVHFEDSHQDGTPFIGSLPLVQSCDGQVDAWHLEAAQRSAFLARLKHLNHLHLSSWPSEAALLALLTLYSRCAHSQFTRLTLTGHVSLTTTSSISQTYPKLQQLQLVCTSANLHTSGELEGDLLLPLLDLPLTHVSAVLMSCSLQLLVLPL